MHLRGAESRFPARRWAVAAHGREHADLGAGSKAVRLRAPVRSSAEQARRLSPVAHRITMFAAVERIADGLQPGGAQPGRLRQESRLSHAPRRGVGAGAGVRCDLGGGGTVGTFAPDDGARQGRRLHARRPVGGGGPVWRAGARRADPGRRRGGDDDLARRGRAGRHRAGAARRDAGCVSSLARPSAPLIPP